MKKIAAVLNRQAQEKRDEQTYLRNNEAALSIALAAAMLTSTRSTTPASAQPQSQGDDVGPESAKKPTPKEQRGIWTKGIWDNIAAERTKDVQQTARTDKKTANSYQKPPTVKSSSSGNKNLLPDWQSRIQPVQLGTDRLGTASTKARQSQEKVGGLVDHDVTQNDAGRNTQPSGRAKMVRIVEPSADQAVPELKPKTSRRVTRKGDGNSEAIQPVFNSIIIPTILTHYGGEQNAWDTDHGHEDLFTKLLQEAIDHACPDQGYVVKKSDNIYKQARQKVYDWRAQFKKIANAVLRDEIQILGLSAQETEPFVNDALQKQLAYHGRGDDGELRIFQSKYLLNVFASHFESIQGSLRDDVAYPIGAFALSLLAVQVAFQSFETGRFVAGPQFNEKNFGDDFDIHVQNVRDLLKPNAVHRFDAVIAKAKAIVTTKPGTRQSSLRRAPQSMPITTSRAPRIFQASSPPPEVPSSPELTGGFEADEAILVRHGIEDDIPIAELD
ncbi:hypothetical protein QCA50_012571 [Cerrena zonata]|uniref:DUF6532 domain-containing protein n=1 Tax=Cerrena zonata TaxID=2478898 RepID=A0AAW0FVR8_9APHY